MLLQRTVDSKKLEKAEAKIKQKQERQVVKENKVTSKSNGEG